MINYDIPKPNTSAHFSIDDIRKIREWHYEQLKDATVKERMAYYNYSAHSYTDNNREEG